MGKQLSVIANPEKMHLNNSGTVELSRIRRIEEIKVTNDFSTLFPIREDILKDITEKILESGYDKSWPVHIWKEQDMLVDGHTRRLAALNAGLMEIPAFEHSFASLEEAIEYAISCQTSRRNLNDAELFTALSKLDQLKNPGKKSEDSEEEKGKSSEKLAAKLNTSARKVEKARAVQKQGTDEIKEAVSSGKMSINKAYQEIKNSHSADIEPDGTHELVPDNNTEHTDLPEESFSDDILSDVEEELLSTESEPFDTSSFDLHEKISFLVTVIGLLVEKNEINAVGIIINFLSKETRQALYDSLPLEVLTAITGPENA